MLLPNEATQNKVIAPSGQKITCFIRKARKLETVKGKNKELGLKGFYDQQEKGKWRHFMRN